MSTINAAERMTLATSYKTRSGTLPHKPFRGAYGNRLRPCPSDTVGERTTEIRASFTGSSAKLALWLTACFPSHSSSGSSDGWMALEWINSARTAATRSFPMERKPAASVLCA